MLRKSGAGKILQWDRLAGGGVLWHHIYGEVQWLLECVMQIFRTSRLAATAGAGAFVDLLDPILRGAVEPISSQAVAVWDVRQLTDGRNLYHLCLHDAWSHIHQHFSQEEISPDMPKERLVPEKLALFLASARRVHFSIRSGTFDTETLANLRLALNQIPGIGHKGLKIQNKCEIIPCTAYVPATAMSLTDFSLEVDASAADAVALALQDCGFQVASRTVVRN
jgi:hypothetical protein